MKNLTKRLRVLRAERDITQRDLALKVGMSIQRYWEIENGYRKADESEQSSIARVLKADRTNIFDDGAAAVARG